MPVTAASVRHRSVQRMRKLRLAVGEEIQRLRLDAGITLTELSAVTCLDRSHLRRIESAEATASVEALVAIGVALGADLSLRYFAGTGPRLVDRFQAPMVEEFLRRLSPRWSTRLEVPVETPRRGVVDAGLFDGRTRLVVATQFQSEFRRLEQEIRWNVEKGEGIVTKILQEDGDRPWVGSRLLVVRSTVSTRAVAKQYEATLRAAYPARTRDVLDALTSRTAAWPGPGVVWMIVEAGKARMLDGPARGVRAGR
jgi:transcriptional regulator with XRE-family HTH domain